MDVLQEAEEGDMEVELGRVCVQVEEDESVTNVSFRRRDFQDFVLV